MWIQLKTFFINAQEQRNEEETTARQAGFAQNLETFNESISNLRNQLKNFDCSLLRITLFSICRKPIKLEKMSLNPVIVTKT